METSAAEKTNPLTAGVNVHFKFRPKQFVVTPFGERGLIDMCAHRDASNNSYYVKTANSDQWYDEQDLLFPHEY